MTSRKIIALVFALLIGTSFVGLVAENALDRDGKDDKEDRYVLSEDSKQTTIRTPSQSWFTENEGQYGNPEVGFAYSSQGCSIGFVESGYLMNIADGYGGTGIVRVRFMNANPVIPEGRDELECTSNFYLGKDTDNWRSGVRSYREVLYEDLYDGIGLVYYASESGLKYDFLVAPEAEAADIEWCYEGADNIFIGASGRLHISTPYGEMIEDAPYSYQRRGSELVEIESFYSIREGRVEFSLGPYDRTEELVIDPLLYSTYVGGSLVDEPGDAIVLDDEGNAYVIGLTRSADFPNTTGSYDNTHNDNWDVVVFKLDTDGSDLIYSTYLGGSDEERGFSLTIDVENNVYLTGHSKSMDFPVTDGCYDDVHDGEGDVFVTKMNHNGSSLLYSTYVGGGSWDRGWDITLDSDLNAYVTGDTSSADFPTTVGAYDMVLNGGYDGFVFKLNADGSDLEYSTLFGGNDWDYGRGIVLDPDEYAYIAGFTKSRNFQTTVGCYDNTHNGNFDAVVCKLNQDGTDMEYASYLGGGGEEYGKDIVIDSERNAYVTGHTRSPDFPTTAGCYSDSNSGKADVFVTMVNADCSDLIYSTYIGGSDDDGYQDVGFAFDSDYNAYITGMTKSDDFPTTIDAYDDSFHGVQDAFVCILNSTFTDLLYGSYVGGNAEERGSSIAINDEKEMYVVGYTKSGDFPVTPGAYDESHNGNSDIFVFRLERGDVKIPPVVTISSPDNNSEVSGIAMIEGVAYDENGNETIEKVELSIDRGEWTVVSGTTSWSFEWDTETVGDGKHKLEVRAFDGTYYSEMETISLKVANTLDNTRPGLSIDSPGNHSEVSGSVWVRGTADDADGDETIESVEVSIDGGDWIVVSGTTDWEFSWDSTSVEDGEYDLRFRAQDGSDYSEIRFLVLRVKNEVDNYRPTVHIGSPQDGTQVSGLVVITGTASDEDGEETIETVEASVDYLDWISATGTDSWEYQWDTNAEVNGEHALRFRAYDGTDYSELAEITLHVRNEAENTIPTVTITNPANLSQITGNVYFDGIASDTDGSVEMVEISINYQSWLEAEGSGYWSYQWDSGTVDNGEYVIRVRCYDGTDYSDEVVIIVIVNNGEKDDDEDSLIPGFGGWMLICSIAIGCLAIGIRNGSLSSWLKKSF